MRPLTDLQAFQLRETLRPYDTYFNTDAQYLALRELERDGLCTSRPCTLKGDIPGTAFVGTERGRTALRIHEAWLNARQVLEV